MLNGDPKDVLKEKDRGYSIGGPIGKPGGTNKLFFFYSQEFSPRTAGNDVQRFRVPDRARARRRFLADARSERRALQLDQGSARSPAPAPRRTRPRLLRGRWRARQDSGRPPVPDRAQHPEAVSAAQRRRPGDRLQLRGHAAEREHAQLAAGRPRRLSADARSCAPRSSTPAGSSGASRSRHCCPASTTRRCSGR